MSAENNIRLFLVLLGVYAVMFGPWWLVLVPIVLLSMRFRAWEAILLGLLADFVWLPVAQMPYYFLGALIIVWAFEPLRKELLLS